MPAERDQVPGCGIEVSAEPNAVPNCRGGGDAVSRNLYELSAGRYAMPNSIDQVPSERDQMPSVRNEVPAGADQVPRGINAMSNG